jgi:hypothetical protein
MGLNLVLFDGLIALVRLAYTQQGRQMRHLARSVSSLTLVVLSMNALGASPPKDRELRLTYIPQGAEHDVSPTISAGLLTRPVKLVFEDGRPSSEQAVVGEGTDDSDRIFPWRASGPVPEYARNIFERIAVGWGIRFDDQAKVSLALRLIRFYLTEKHQFVGSSYLAEVRVAFELRAPDGTILAAGVAAGDASRYGRKGSADNCNEVLSDATRASYLRLIDNRDLQAAWSGEKAPAPTVATPAPQTSS